MTKPRPIIERMMAKRRINPATGCWIWAGAKSNGHGRWASRSGYGYVRDEPANGGKMILVHRASFRHFKGPIPDGHTIDHDCVNRLCWNPDHLFDVTHRRNCELRDARARQAAAGPVALPDNDIPF